MNYFITGATGTLGTEVVSKLVSSSDGTIFVLVRSSSAADATNRLRSLWWELPGLLSEIGGRVVPVTGDITLNGLGIKEEQSAALRRDVSHVIHCAAETGIKKSKETLRSINVEGTRNVVDFAASFDDLKRFVHVSTAPMPGVKQDRQLLMPFVSKREKYIISPYMDWLSFFFNKSWRKPMHDIVSIMIKLADVEQGDVTDRKMRKKLTETDHRFLSDGVRECKEILSRLGASEGDMFLGTLNCGHPGGMLPLTQAESRTLHSPKLPENMYVADASILPQALGLPPILTIMALAKRISKLVPA